MKRRTFLNSIMVAGASFAILPGAGRIWKVERQIVPVTISFPPFEVTEIMDAMRQVLDVVERVLLLPNGHATLQDHLRKQRILSKYGISNESSLIP